MTGEDADYAKRVSRFERVAEVAVTFLVTAAVVAVLVVAGKLAGLYIPHPLGFAIELVLAIAMLFVAIFGCMVTAGVAVDAE